MIGANSVVTRDIPEFSVAAGVPAKVVSSTLSANGTGPIIDAVRSYGLRGTLCFSAAEHKESIGRWRTE